MHYVIFGRFRYMNFLPKCRSIYLSQIKSDLHETFSIFQDRSPELTNNVRGCASARVHAKRVKLCMQLWAVYNPSYFSQMKSDIHETFSICQDWSPELINNVHGCATAFVHGEHVLCMHARMCMLTNNKNQLRILILIYTESFMKI